MTWLIFRNLIAPRRGRFWPLARTWLNSKWKLLFTMPWKSFPNTLELVSPNLFLVPHRCYVTHIDSFFVSALLRDYSLCCERYMTPTLDAALLISSRAGTDPGLSSNSRVWCFSRFDADERHPKVREDLSPRRQIYANPVNFVFVWVPVTGIRGWRFKNLCLSTLQHSISTTEQSIHHT